MPVNESIAADPTGAAPSAGLAVDAALLAMALFWATNMVVLKSLLAVLPPPALSATRFALVSLLAMAVAAFRREPKTIDRGDWLRLVGCAVSGITLYQILFMEGLERTTAFTSNLMQGTEPLLALFLLSLTGAAVVQRRQWGGVLLSFVGAVLFFLQDAGSGTALAFGRGDALNLASAVVFAIYGLLSGPLFRRYPGSTAMAWTMGVGTLPLLLWAYPVMRSVDWLRLGPIVWGELVFSSVLPVYVGYWIWNWAIARKGLAHASLYIFVDIVVTGVFAYFFLGERFGALRLVGAAVILLGVHLARAGEPPHPE
jgi:drug/metabolite transporter (DMT)-like permease